MVLLDWIQALFERWQDMSLGRVVFEAFIVFCCLVGPALIIVGCFLWGLFVELPRAIFWQLRFGAAAKAVKKKLPPLALKQPEEDCSYPRQEPIIWEIIPGATFQEVNVLLAKGQDFEVVFRPRTVDMVEDFSLVYPSPEYRPAVVSEQEVLIVPR